MNIGIIGCRARDGEADYASVKKGLDDLLALLTDIGTWMPNVDEHPTIISGGCPKGGDRFAEILADLYGFLKIIHYPQIPEGVWLSRKDFSTANYSRDLLIARDSDVLIACVHPSRGARPGEGRGTEHTINAFVSKPNHHPSSIILV